MDTRPVPFKGRILKQSAFCSARAGETRAGTNNASSDPTTTVQTTSLHLSGNETARLACSFRQKVLKNVCVPSLNTSRVAGCLAGRCLWAIGKPIWLVSVLLWMRAAGSLAGDWTAMLRLAAEA